MMVLITILTYVEAVPFSYCHLTFTLGSRLPPGKWNLTNRNDR